MRPSGGRRKTDWRRIVLGLLLALFCGQFCSRQVSAMEERKQSNSYGLQTEKDADETNAGTVSGTSDPVSQELVSDMSFEQVQKLMDEMLGEESFSMETALKNMISGETVFSKEAVQSFLRSLFLIDWSRNGPTLCAFFCWCWRPPCFPILRQCLKMGRSGM